MPSISHRYSYSPILVILPSRFSSMEQMLMLMYSPIFKFYSIKHRIITQSISTVLTTTSSSRDTYVDDVSSNCVRVCCLRHATPCRLVVRVLLARRHTSPFSL